ncbi:MAG: hypothetical protein ACT4TC_15995 [Myxococcaceae bacterium]
MEEQAIPCERPGLTGSIFLEETKALSRGAREGAIFDAIAGGAVPSFTHTFAEVALIHGEHAGAVRVALDYAAIGTDNDFVRIAMSPITAQRLADQFGYVLPTRSIVDAIYRAAVVKLAPSPLPPGPQMMSNDYYRRHHEAVEKQRAGRGCGTLIAGHKKDVVVTKRLVARPDRVAIYGWHRLDGRPIQPLSLVHEARYADYSHGVRFLQATMVVEGVKRSIGDVVRDPELCGLASDEGPLSTMRVAAPFS